MRSKASSWARWAIVGIGGFFATAFFGGLALLVVLAVGLSLSMPSCEVELGSTDDDRNPELERAIAACDVEGVEAELVKGADQFDGGAFELFDGGGPTMEAALACGPGMTVLLTRFSVGNDGGDAVLQAAVATGDPELVTAALDAGADVDGQDGAGDTALLDAVTRNDGPMVELLLTRGADPDVANDAGHTPLLRAVGFDRAPLVSSLLGAGADPDLAAAVTRAEVVLAGGGLLDAAGNPVDQADLPGTRVIEALAPALGYLDAATVDTIRPITPLYVAVAVSTDEVVLALLAAGADPTIGSGPARHLPADAADLLGRTDLAARIRAAG
jgi:hypothetical protein